MGKLGGIVAVVYFIVAAYFLNLAFGWYSLPDTTPFNFSINVIVAVLLIIGAFSFWKYNRMTAY